MSDQCPEVYEFGEAEPKFIWCERTAGHDGNHVGEFSWERGPWETEVVALTQGEGE